MWADYSGTEGLSDAECVEEDTLLTNKTKLDFFPFLTWRCSVYNRNAHFSLDLILTSASESFVRCEMFFYSVSALQHQRKICLTSLFLWHEGKQDQAETYCSMLHCSQTGWKSEVLLRIISYLICPRNLEQLCINGVKQYWWMNLGIFGFSLLSMTG